MSTTTTDSMTETIDGTAKAGTVCLPVPDDAPTPPDSHYRHGTAARSWWYTDGEGVRLFRVLRFDVGNGKKEIIPQTWSGEKWQHKAWPTPRPLYGLHWLVTNPNKPVVVVEGEKAADALQRMLGDGYCVVSWSGGAQADKNTDWKPLTDRLVVLWPDADDPGISVMDRIAKRARKQGCTVATIQVHSFPEGFDAADCPPLQAVALVETTQARAEKAAAKVEVSIKSWLPWVDERPPVTDPHDLPPYESGWRHMKDGFPLSTLPNMERLLEHYHIAPRTNEVSKQIELGITPGVAYKSVTMATITSLCQVNRLPVGQVVDYVQCIAEANSYNPARQWVQSQPWDGADRVTALAASLGIADSHHRVLLWRWLVSAVSVLCEDPPPTAQGVLVLQGSQGIGKSRWLATLTGGRWAKMGHILDPSNTDNVSQCIGNWIVELGELDATIRKSDVARLKAFITLDYDEFRRPYAREAVRYPRRTVFAASVNPSVFLHDPTGNRRWWVIPVTTCDPNHGLDMQQVWAQVLDARTARGERHYLQGEELQVLEKRNEAHLEVTPEEDLLRTKFAHDLPRNRKMTAAEVCIACGYERPSNQQARSMSTALRKLYGEPKVVNGRTIWLLPVTTSGA